MFDLSRLNTNLMKFSAIAITLLVSILFILDFLIISLLERGETIQYVSIIQTVLLSSSVFLASLCLMNLAEVMQKNIIKKIGLATLILTLIGVLLYFIIYFYFNSLIIISRLIFAISEILLLINLFLVGKYTKITAFDLVALFFILGLFIDLATLTSYFILVILLFRINKKMEKINKVDKTLGITQNVCPACGKKLGFSYLECSSCKRHFCYEHARHEGNNIYCFDCSRRMRR